MSDAASSPQGTREAYSPSPSAEASLSRPDAGDAGDDSAASEGSEDEVDEVDEVEDDDVGDETRAGANETTLGDITMADSRMFADGDGDESRQPLQPRDEESKPLTEEEIEHREAVLAGEIQPPDINPGSANLYSTATGDKL